MMISISMNRTGLDSSSYEHSLSKLSPFAVAKAIKGIAGEPKSVKKLSSGHILIESERRQHAENLLKCIKFVEIPVRASPHKTMNSSKGVFRSRDLNGTDETEMTANLNSQGVTTVKRVQIRRDGKSILTNTYILTFNSPIISKVIKAGFVLLAVSPFVPNPLRCFNCQRFGHHRDRCKRSDTCPRCGKEGHDGSDFSAEVKCVNCDGNHPAYAKVCPLWIREKEIQTVKVTNNITFFDAKKIVDSRGRCSCRQENIFFRCPNRVRPSMKSFSVQTDLTWPKAASTANSSSVWLWNQSDCCV